MWRNLLDGCARALIAPRCVLCTNPCSKYLCAACHGGLPRLVAQCARCAEPLAVSAALCTRCQQDPPPFTRVCVPLRYQFPVDALLRQFKFQQRLDLRGLLAAELLQHLLAGALAGVQVDLILPVPLSTARLRERGFNQAHEIAKRLAVALPLPLRADLCTRVRDTPAQTNLSARERARNLRAAFAVSTPIRGLRIAVVDDVVTTTETARAVSRALLHAGAAAVEIWALARAGSAVG